MAVRKEVANTKQCLDINFKVLTALGVWNPTHYRGTRWQFVYKIYSFVFLGFHFYLFLLTVIVLLFTVLGDLNAMVNAFFVILTLTSELYKALNTMMRRNRIQKLLDSLDQPVLNLVDAESMPRILKDGIFLRRCTKILLVFCFGTIFMWAIFPFLDGEQYRLPLVTWTPFDVKRSPHFELMFAYQILSCEITSFLNAALDTLISGTMALACIQLDNLHEKLRDSKKRYVPLNHPDPGINSEDHLLRNIEIREHLENCIEHHLAIIRFVEEAAEVFGIPVLVQFGATSFNICVTALKLTTLPMSIELFSMLMFMTFLLAEVLLYCYYGNELIIKSQGISQAAYESLWYEHSLENRKLILLLMERSKRPLSVAAFIFELSLTTFMQIIRSSYSYFAVLNQVNNK